MLHDKPFNEAEFRAELIARGTDPKTAATVAARTAAGRAGYDLFSQVAEPKDIPAAKVQMAKKAKQSSLTVRESKLLDAGVMIAANPPTGEDMAFTHAVLCQVGLPRAKVEGRDFIRRSGNVELVVSAGYLTEGREMVLQPIPYGAIPRLALAWVSTFAVRNKERQIPIGESAAEFLRLMGMDDQGARYTTLRRQMHALAACRLQMGYMGRTLPNMAPVKQFDAWLSDKEKQQRALWPGVMVLSEDYYGSLIESAVPLDNRALMALKGSALALDVYTWLAHRLHRIQGRARPLYWANLREQFAQEYKGKDPDKDFKKEFLPALKKVLAVYPQAKVKPVTGGILLQSSPPPIPYKGGPTV